MDEISGPNNNKCSLSFSNQKHYFVGISLASAATTESGVAILDSELNIVTLDKLFTIEDVKFFMDNFVGKQNAVFNISIPENPTMLNAKWKLHSRQYQLVQTNRLVEKESDWMQRYSFRGCDYFKELKNNGIDIFRYDVHDLRSSFGLSGMYKDRTPVDCKAFQSALKFKFGIRELPTNMLPAAQLEALLGAYFAYAIAKEEVQGYVRADFKGIDVIGLRV